MAWKQLYVISCKIIPWTLWKHATPLLANRISHVWKSLPSQLAKENRKFVYQLVRPGARAREYEDALTWLKNAGLIYKVSLCSLRKFLWNRMKIWASSRFIVLMWDYWECLLIWVLRLIWLIILYLKEYKGALAENYILQSLVANGVNCSHYWASGNKAEVEFIVQRGLEVIPVEVKSGTSVTGRSLIEYNKGTHLVLRIRYSMLNLRGWFLYQHPWVSWLIERRNWFLNNF